MRLKQELLSIHRPVVATTHSAVFYWADSSCELVTKDDYQFRSLSKNDLIGLFQKDWDSWESMGHVTRCLFRVILLL